MMFNNDAFMAGMKIPTKYSMEQELAQKQQLLRHQADLEKEALTPELKLFNLMQQNPDGFRKFMEMKNSMSPYQEAMLGIQRGQLGLQGARLNAENTTTQQQNADYIFGQLVQQGMPAEQARIEAWDRAGLKKPPLSKEEAQDAFIKKLQGSSVPGGAR